MSSRGWSDYFKNYAGEGKSYAANWRGHTFNPKSFIRKLKELNVKYETVFDVGAADGSWLKAIWPHANLVQGIEIYKSIIPREYLKKRIILAGDIKSYDFDRHWDVIHFNGMSHLEEGSVLPVIEKILRSCSVFVMYANFWDRHTRVGKKDIDLKYENTLRFYKWWLESINIAGGKVIHFYDGAFFIVKGAQTPRLDYSASYYSNMEPVGKNALRFGDVTVSYKGRDIVVSKNARERDLIQLTFLLSVLEVDSQVKRIRTEDKRNNFVPGWTNTDSGELDFYCGLI
jgi:hypothetical protein